MKIPWLKTAIVFRADILMECAVWQTVFFFFLRAPHKKEVFTSPNLDVCRLKDRSKIVNLVLIWGAVRDELENIMVGGAEFSPCN